MRSSLGGLGCFICVTIWGQLQKKKWLDTTRARSLETSFHCSRMMLLLIRTLAIHRQTPSRCSIIRFASSARNNKDEHRPTKVREGNVIDFKEPVVIKPIRQELIKTIPVEFHGVAPGDFNDQSEWYPIFRSPYLNAMRRMIKFKLYLTAFSFLSSLGYASQLFYDSPINVWKPAILSTLTLVGLVFIGDFARRLIVQIYVSKDLQYVRFCRFTFFGSRRDMVLPRECIVKLTEINSTQRAPILNVKFIMPEKGVALDYDNYEFYELGFRLPLGLGGVLDRERFNSALGKILVKKPLGY
uniref:Transmembrane protein 186 n=1 Tax=Aceria tosichella TaxID=561515 RepID=A0A6G1SDZ1_9ACAR